MPIVALDIAWNVKSIIESDTTLISLSAERLRDN